MKETLTAITYNFSKQKTSLYLIAFGISIFLWLASIPVSGQLPYQVRPGDNATRYYVDVTSELLPYDPELHALDALFLDVDQDGDLDVILAVEHGANRLYINDGKGKLSWKKGAFGDVPHDSEHVLSADFNRDGFPDVVFVAEDDRFHQLFLGSAGGTFKDVSDRLPAKSEGNGLAIGDVNGDGLPDIVVGNTSERRGPNTEETSSQNFLWLNDSKKPGFFIDVTKTHLPQVNDQTQDIKLFDLDGDGDLDMVVANQDPPNRLLINDGKGHFSEAFDRLDLKVPMETRMVQVFDANGDNKPDLIFFNLTSNAGRWEKDPQTRLLINDGNGKFKDETTVRLPSHTFSSWGGKIIDFNNDGHPDILVGAIQVPGFVPLQAKAWMNDGKGNFRDATLEVIPSLTIGRHWGMAVGDLTGDGNEDIFIGAWGTQSRLLIKRTGQKISSEQSKSDKQKKDNMNIHLTVIVKSKPEHLAEVQAVLEDMVQQTRKEEACLQYELYQNTEDKNVFVFHETWRDKEGMEIHGQQPYIKKFMELAKEKFQEVPQIIFTQKLQ